MISREQGKSMMKEIVQRFNSDEKNPQLHEFPLSEQDLKTKYIVSMLQALNWDIYDINQVREQKNFYGLLPDYILTDDHEKLILVEVKLPSAWRDLEKDLRKYRDNAIVRQEAAALLLTTFRDSEICILGKRKGMRTTKIPHSKYVSEFNQLWAYLSNSEEGFKTRIHEKALSSRT